MKKYVLRGIQFLSQLCNMYVTAVLVISVTGYFFGEEAAAYSSLYQMGDRGISYPSLLQLFLCVFVIAIIVEIFFSERILRKLMLIWRIVPMLASITLVIAFFIYLFEWFPLDYIPGWIGFFVSFVGCFLASTAIMLLKMKAEGKKYDKLLEEYKKKQKET